MPRTRLALLAIGNVRGTGGAQLQLLELASSVRLSPARCVQLPELSWLPRPLRWLLRIALLNVIILWTRPRTVLLFQSPAIALAPFVLRSTSLRLVIAERNDPFSKFGPRQLDRLRRGFAHADVAVVQTQRLAARVFREWGVQAVVAPNVTPSSVLDQIGPLRPYRDRSPVLVYVGRLTESKRVDDLLAAFDRLGPDFDGWTLHLIGSGPLEPELRRTAGSLSSGRHVTFSPHMTQREIVAVLRDARMFVFASEREGYPNSLKEASLHCLALAAYDCDYGPREILEDRPFSSTVRTGSVDELTSALKRLRGAIETAGELSELETWISERADAARRAPDVWTALLAGRATA